MIRLASVTLGFLWSSVFLVRWLCCIFLSARIPGQSSRFDQDL